jgi:hypothetical protein
MKSTVIGWLAGCLLVTSACATTVKNVHQTAPLRAKARWVMLPVANYAETPQAGERLEALLDTVLRQDGIGALDQYPPLKEDDSHLIMSDRQRYQESLAWAQQQHFDYAVAGSVEEWRYKSGLDAEPAVGVTVQVIELATNRVVWSASGTRTGNGGDNASGTALQLVDTLLADLRVVQ